MSVPSAIYQAFTQELLSGPLTPLQYANALAEINNTFDNIITTASPTVEVSPFNNSGNTKTSASTQIVGVESVRFIRGKAIQFKATDLKPNTLMYAFFDDVPVTEFCKLNNGSSVLTTDTNGVIIGIFNIPDYTFNTGPKTFKLQDIAVPLSNVPVGSLTSTAQAAYFTSGIKTSQQSTITTVTTNKTQRQVYG